jgi:hypothetical protein
MRKRDQCQEYQIDPENHVIDRKNGLIKNFMRLTNKTLIGLQRIQVNKSTAFYCALGLGLGYLTSELEDHFVDFSHNYRKVVKNIIVQEVLRN